MKVLGLAMTWRSKNITEAVWIIIQECFVFAIMIRNYILFFFETLWDFAVTLKVAKILLWLYQKNDFGQKCRNNNSLVN